MPESVNKLNRRDNGKFLCNFRGGTSLPVSLAAESSSTTPRSVVAAMVAVVVVVAGAAGGRMG
jgi:hypothetical protein